MAALLLGVHFGLIAQLAASVNGWLTMGRVWGDGGGERVIEGAGDVMKFFHISTAVSARPPHFICSQTPSFQLICSAACPAARQKPWLKSIATKSSLARG